MKSPKKIASWFGIIAVNVIASACWMITSVPLAWGQPPGLSIPNIDYYRSYEFLRDGRTDDADTGFRTALRPLNLAIEQRGFESIPSLVMLGECYYLKGKLSDAIDQYDQALFLAVKSSGWSRFVEEYQGTERTETVGKDVGWGTSARKAKSGNSFARWVFTSGAMEAGLYTPTGERIVPGIRVQVDAMEIFRTTAIALWRRRQILGPIALESEQSREIERALSTNIGKLGPGLLASLKTCQAIASLSTESADSALATLQAHTTLPGNVDFPLTPFSLLIQGHLAAEQGLWSVATKHFSESALAAAHFEQFDVASEATLCLSLVASHQKEIAWIPVLQQIGHWSKTRSRFMVAASAAGLATMQIAIGDFGPLPGQLRQLNLAIAPRDIILPRYEAWAYWCASRAAFATNNPREGVEALETALKKIEGEEDAPMCRRSFQEQIALQRFRNGKVGPQEMRRILERLHKGPSDTEWVFDPIETLASEIKDRGNSFDTAIGLELLHGTPTSIAMSVDYGKRRTFSRFDTLGGRLLAARQLMTMPLTSLGAESNPIALRLRNLFPEVLTMSNRIDETGRKLCEEVTIDLKSLPDSGRENWDRWMVDVNRLENSISLIALSNQPFDLAIPRGLRAENLKDHDSELGIVIAYFASQGNIHGLALASDSIETWKVGPAAELQRSIAKLLELLGIPRPTGDDRNNSATALRQLKELRSSLIPAKLEARLSEHSKIVWVPHAFLWYFPFELLPEDPRGGSPLLSKYRISYAVTLGDAWSRNVRRNPNPRTIAITVPKYFSENEPKHRESVKKILSLPSSYEFEFEQGMRPLPSRWARSQADRYWVAGRLSIGDNGILFPFGYDRGVDDGALISWMKTPLRTPAHLVLPGLETPLTRGQIGDGSELFHLACVARATGNESLLVSRWPMRGLSAAALIETYLVGTETESSSSAWQRAVLANWEEKFELADEPNLQSTRNSGFVSGANPILWSGLLQIGDAPPPVAAP